MKKKEIVEDREERSRILNQEADDCPSSALKI